METPITFMASIEGRGCLKYDGDGAGRLILTVPASSLASLVLLLSCREMPLKVTIEPQPLKA